MNLYISKLCKLVLLCVIVTLSGCSDDSTSSEEQPCVTLVCPLGGFGDGGYNDLIMRGVMRSYEKHQMEMSVAYPSDMNEAKSLIAKFCAEQSGKKRLLILADSNYGDLIDAATAVPDNSTILVADAKSSSERQGVTTFYINRYGAFYLAGKMAAPHQEATVIAAMPGDMRLEEAIAGFRNGYGKKITTIYLADDTEGYSMPDQAYKLTADIENSFIVPLAGGSNSGVYKYSRERNFYLSLIAGMDSDCQLLSNRVPFSIVINVDSIIEELIGTWYDSGLSKRHYEYGLADGGIEIKLSDVFYNWSYIWEDYYLDDEYWSDAYNKYKAEAIGKEEEYEAD
jgi:basic membrane protein A